MTTFSTPAALMDARLQGLCGRIGLQRRYFDAREYLRAKRETLDMSENRTRNVLFVHVPKCAGTSIFKQVPIAHGHRSAQFFKWHDPELFEKAFTFGFVRNPYDRLVSAFHYLRSEKTSVRDGEFGKRTVGHYADFPDFLEAIKSKSTRAQIAGWMHFIPQTYYLCDRHNNVLVDFVGRTEAFGEGITTVNEKTGLSLQNINQGRKVKRAPYKDLYTPETAKIAEEMFAIDFEVFGFEKEHDF